MISIIIPAHNEERTIGPCLNAVIQQISNQDEVIVICNGCTDSTYEVATSFSPNVEVLNVSKPSKSNALNIGDTLAQYFPRIYLDADIVLQAGAVSGLVEALNDNTYLAASPIPLMDLTNSSYFVRAYYEIWLDLPYCRKGMIGSGVYAVSEIGRRRFEEFPNIIADDRYLRSLFKESERTGIMNVNALVTAPSSIKWLLKIKTRSRLGGIEFCKKFPSLCNKNEEKDYLSVAKGWLFSPMKWHKITIYMFVNLISRYKARSQYKSINYYEWEKDLSSR